MGSSKRQSHPKAQLRSRTTRSSKGRLLSDPAENNQLLTEQLRSLGLYAAPTLGDGNCLFRALSDQLYGTPSRHAQLRKDICDWIQAHKSRYEPFVEDERGLDTHLRCMRENATYGGHMELSAFAHLTRRNVKVIQPGLVYVIEWAAGGDPSSSSQPSSPVLSSAPPPPTLPDSERRRGREKKKSSSYQDVEHDASNDGEDGTVYVAYHDWEHFSSIRSLRGPHTGLPMVRENPAPQIEPTLPPPAPAKKVPKVKLKLSAPSTPAGTPPPRDIKPKSKSSVYHDPAQIPLPISRSVSPYSHSLAVDPAAANASASNRSSPLSSASSSSASSSRSPPAPQLPPGSPMKLLHSPTLTLQRNNRSPKRSFDESSASGEEGAHRSREREKRSRRGRAGADDDDDDNTKPAGGEMDIDVDVIDVDVDDSEDADASESGEHTPSLSPPGSLSTSSLSSLSSSSSASPSPPPPPPPPQQKPLTRRQRKALGLPKPRAQLAYGRGTGNGLVGASAGKIVIPGGKFQGGKGVKVEGEGEGGGGGDEEEWKRNGTGRVDVRGFRELKI